MTAEWTGEERRRKSRDDQTYNLDFTWQNEVYSIRRELHDHMQREDDNQQAIAEIKAELKAIFDPEAGRFTALERDIKVLVSNKYQVVGGFHALSWIGAGTISILGLVAALWDHIWPPK